MHLAQRKIAEDETQALAKVFLNAFDHWICAAAIRALVVAIFDESACRVFVALDVIGRADWNFECAHNVLLFRQGFQSLKDAIRSGIDGDGRAIAPGDNSIFIDDEESAFASAFGFAICAIGLGGSALGLEIGEQRKTQMAIFR